MKYSKNARKRVTMLGISTINLNLKRWPQSKLKYPYDA